MTRLALIAILVVQQVLAAWLAPSLTLRIDVSATPHDADPIQEQCCCCDEACAPRPCQTDGPRRCAPSNAPGNTPVNTQRPLNTDATTIRVEVRAAAERNTPTPDDRLTFVVSRAAGFTSGGARAAHTPDASVRRAMLCVRTT